MLGSSAVLSSLIGAMCVLTYVQTFYAPPYESARELYYIKLETPSPWLINSSALWLGQMTSHLRSRSTLSNTSLDRHMSASRRMHGLERTQGGAGEIIVVKRAKEFIQLLNEFGNYVEIQNHLDLRGLSNTDFERTRILNGRFAFRALKGNCSDPFPRNPGTENSTVVQKKNNQCLIMLGGTETDPISDFDLMLTSIRENPTSGEPLWIDNVYFTSTGRSKVATLYVGGGLMLTNVTMQGGNIITGSGAVEAIDYAVHAQDSMFIDYLAKDSATFRCATKGTYCSFKACNFSIPNFTAHSRPQSQTIVGSVNEASVTVENVDAFPGPAAVWVDTPQNMRNAFYTDEGLTVISKGKAVSETQPLDEISDKRAQRFIAVEDEWFQSLQRDLSWADRKTFSGKYLYTPIGAPAPERGPLLFGRAIEAWTLNFVWLGIAMCLTVAAAILCLTRNKPTKVPSRPKCERCQLALTRSSQSTIQNEGVQHGPLQLPSQVSIFQRYNRPSNPSGTHGQVGEPQTACGTSTLYSKAPHVHARLSPSPDGQYVTVQLSSVTEPGTIAHERYRLGDGAGTCTGICDPFAEATENVAAQYGRIWPSPPWLAGRHEHDGCRRSTASQLQGEQSIYSAVSIVPDATSEYLEENDSGIMYSGGTTKLMY